jgi:hypothetical protein
MNAKDTIEKETAATAIAADQTGDHPANPRMKKIPLVDLGSASLETKGSFGGFLDSPSPGNPRPHPGL